jgi:hypothetical protein
MAMMRTIQMRIPGVKVLAGVVNKFNCDLPGGASYWPPEYNPPIEWVRRFTDVLTNLRNECLPLSTSEKMDLVLHRARAIPVMFQTDNGQKFARLVTLDRGDTYEHEVTLVETKECDAGGENWIGEAGTSAETYVCDGCHSEVETDDAYVCHGCSMLRCDICCTGCVDCTEVFCEGCMNNRDMHDCVNNEEED